MKNSLYKSVWLVDKGKLPTKISRTLIPPFILLFFSSFCNKEAFGLKFKLFKLFKLDILLFKLFKFRSLFAFLSLVLNGATVQLYILVILFKANSESAFRQNLI